MADRTSQGMKLAELVKRGRKALDWTQEDLAAASKVGLRTIARWESGEIERPSPDQFHAVIGVLEISPEDAFRALGWLPEEQPEPATPHRSRTNPETVARIEDMIRDADEFTDEEKAWLIQGIEPTIERIRLRRQLDEEQRRRATGA